MKKKYVSVSHCSYARIIDYTSSILYFIHFSLTTFLVPIVQLFNLDNHCIYWCRYDHMHSVIIPTLFSESATVKIMHLSQLFFHMLTLKALT